MTEEPVGGKAVSIGAKFPGALYESIAHPDGSISIQMLTEGIEAVTGYTVEEFVSDPSLYMQTVFEEDRVGLEEAIGAAITQGKNIEWEGRITTKDGKEKWVHVSGTASPESSGDVRLYGMIVDVNERHKYESELVKMNEYFSMLLDKGPSTFFVREVVPPYRLTYISANADDSFSVPSGQTQLGTQGNVAAVHPDDLKILQDSFEETVKQGKSSIEFRVGDPVLGYKWYLSHKQIARHDPSLMLGVVVDVTEHYEAANAYKRMDARFRAMLEASPAGGMMFDAVGQLVFANVRALKMMGLPLEKLKGKGWLATVHRADRKKVEGLVERATERVKSTSFICRFSQGERETVWCRVEVAPIVVEGHPEGMVASLVDITAQRESEMLAESARLAAERSTSIKQRVIENLFSELHDPIEDLVKQARALAAIVDQDSEIEAGKNLVALTEDVHSRLDALSIMSLENIEDLPVVKVGVHICPLIAREVESAASRAQAMAIALDLKCPSDERAIVSADHERLGQVIKVVIDTAIEANQVEGLLVVTCLSELESTVDVHVTGTCRKEALAWYQAVDRDRQPVNRRLEPPVLRLSVARRLCEAMGGSLVIESEMEIVTVRIGLPKFEVAERGVVQESTDFSSEP